MKTRIMSARAFLCHVFFAMMPAGLRTDVVCFHFKRAKMGRAIGGRRGSGGGCTPTPSAVNVFRAC